MIQKMNNLGYREREEIRMALQFLACYNGDGFNRNTDGERTNFFIFWFGYLDVEMCKKHQNGLQQVIGNKCLKLRK